MAFSDLGISSLYSPPWLTRFPFAKMFKAQWGEDRNMDAIMEISVAHGRPYLFTLRIITNHKNRILFLFLGYLFHALQTLAKQWLPNYHIIMIFSNILSVGSFFSQHRSLDTLWGRLCYTLTL